jgi:hypothetical protein
MFEKVSSFVKENPTFLVVVGWDTVAIIASVTMIARTVSYVATNKALVEAVAAKAIEVAPAVAEKVIA